MAFVQLTTALIGAGERLPDRFHGVRLPINRRSNRRNFTLCFGVRVAEWGPQVTRQVTGPTDRVVVVGAGLGGLACAIRLAAAGREVTVLERADAPGGRAGRLSIDGFDFDT